MLTIEQVNTAATRGLLEWLSARQVPASATMPMKELLSNAIRHSSRILPAKKWQVYCSRTLAASKHYADHARSVMTIIAKATEGRPLLEHHSRSVLNSDSYDLLLSDWGIHHLHLNTNPHKNDLRFVERSGPLLFVYPHGDALILLTILSHDDWTNECLINILHEDFPSSIQHKRQNGIEGLAQGITPSQRKFLRKNYANTWIQVTDGTVYGMIGGGLTTNGQSAKNIVRQDEIQALLDPQLIWDTLVQEHPHVNRCKVKELFISFNDALEPHAAVTLVPE